MKKPEILSNELVAQSRLFKVEQLELRFSNGELRTYERMRGGRTGAVMVVPMIDAEHMLLVREYAAGTHDYQLGFPKGLIDLGESPSEAANRELQEEIGYGSNALQPLMKVALAPSYFASSMDIFLAQNLYQNRLEGDEPEPLEIVKWPIADIDGLLAREDFSESRSITALFLARKRLKLDI